MMRFLFAIMLTGISISLLAQEQKAAHTKTGLSDAQYTARALSAAPSSIAKDAGVLRMDGMKTLRESKNGYTCMLVLDNPMCADANSMAFFEAYSKHEKPPEKLGLSYMLKGDRGASNTDPYAQKKTADNHWVVTGPHIMIVGPGAKSLALSESPDADPTKPYLMWAGTPYEHAMIPVSGGAAKAAAPAKESQAKEKM